MISLRSFSSSNAILILLAFVVVHADVTARSANRESESDLGPFQGPDPCTSVQLTGFEGFSPGSTVLFRLPRFSASTSGYLELKPNVVQVSNAAAYSGNQSNLVQWQFVNTGLPQRWMRLTTFDAPNVPNPTVELNRPIRVRMRVDAGRFRLALGIRETGTAAAVGQNGGTTGKIEWIGATSSFGVDGPQGVLVEPIAPGLPL